MAERPPRLVWRLPSPAPSAPAPELLALARAIARGLALQHDDAEEAALEAGEPAAATE